MRSVEYAPTSAPRTTANAGPYPRGAERRLLALQRSAGNAAVVSALRTSVQRCGSTPASECGCHDDAAAGEAPVQRTADALPWLVSAAEEGVRDVGIGLGAVAAGVAAGAAVLLRPNTSIMSGSEEMWLLGYARGQAAVRDIAALIAELTAMAAITADEVDKLKGRTDDVIKQIEDFIRNAGRAVMRCTAELVAFRALAQQLRDYLSRPLDQINKFELIRLLDQFNAAIQALLTCMGATPPPAD